MRRLVEQFGYKVLEAGDGLEAVAIWEEHSEEIGLLLTDMMMPGGMSGMDLWIRLRQDRPELPVILSSGYNTEVTGLEDANTAGVIYLPKPCSPSTLRAALQHNLAPV